MEFMYLQLPDGRAYRRFNIINDYNREGLTIDVGFSLPTERMIRLLDQLIEWSGKPKAIRCDNGSADISHTLIKRAKKQNITINYIQPGQPGRDAFVEHKKNYSLLLAEPVSVQVSC